MLGVWIAPVTAQVMMSFRCIVMLSPSACPCAREALRALRPGGACGRGDRRGAAPRGARGGGGRGGGPPLGEDCLGGGRLVDRGCSRIGREPLVEAGVARTVIG